VTSCGAPLTPVLTWAGRIAEQSDLRPDVQQALKMVRGNLELEMRLIEDVLDLSRIARGKLTLNNDILRLSLTLPHLDTS
jgi:signal transduction histidine kinase